jgi:recombination protein RecA
MGTEHVNSIDSMREDLQAFLTRARANGGATAAQAVALAKVVSLDELRSASSLAGQSAQAEEPRFSFEALRGRLIELSAGASSAGLSAAMSLVVDAQVAAEPVAWISLHETSFYPPDVVECGVDISALAVIHVPDTASAGRAAERLLRSNAFGLVILDLGAPDCVIERNGVHRTGTKALSIANQGRLVALAQQSDSLVVCITSKKRALESMGSLISLRADASRERNSEGFCVTLRVLKDKRRGPGWSRSEPAKAPAGLT